MQGTLQQDPDVQSFLKASSERFWLQWVETRNDPNCVRVNGVHYYICDEASISTFRGFAGRKFTVKFNDGRVVTTTNMWHQGDIPAALREQLPDNAAFI
jgi:hypothetical protein